MKHDAEGAKAAFDQAFALAPDDECRADVLFQRGQACETLLDRAGTIAAYKRILDEYPSSGHVPRAGFRLGELHRSITLTVHDDTAARDAAFAEMSAAVAAGYFEKAVAAGPGYSTWVLASRMYLAGIYLGDLKRPEEGLAHLRAVAQIDYMDVKAPPYEGPYAEAARGSLQTFSERIDRTRRQVMEMKAGAQKRLAAKLSIRTEEPESSRAD